MRASHLVVLVLAAVLGLSGCMKYTYTIGSQSDYVAERDSSVEVSTFSLECDYGLRNEAHLRELIADALGPNAAEWEVPLEQSEKSRHLHVKVSRASQQAGGADYLCIPLTFLMLPCFATKDPDYTFQYSLYRDGTLVDEAQFSVARKDYCWLCFIPLSVEGEDGELMLFDASLRSFLGRTR